MWTTGQQLTENVIHLLALFLKKKHFFLWLLVVFSFTGSLILCLGLFCILLLPLDILLS